MKIEESLSKFGKASATSFFKSLLSRDANIDDALASRFDAIQSVLADLFHRIEAILINKTPVNAESTFFIIKRLISVLAVFSHDLNSKRCCPLPDC